MATDEILLQITDMIKGLSDKVEGLSGDLSAFKDEVNSRFDKVDERLDKVENQVKENYNAIETLMYKQDGMKKEITEIQLRMENEMRRNFNILSEAAISNSDRIHALEDRVQKIEDDRAIDEVIQELKEKRLIS